MSIEESKILSFLSQDRKFSLYFLEGQEIIKNLAVIHDVKKEAFHFFRDSVLSSLHVTNFLKPGESAGIYLDNENPQFMLKIELDSAGQMRCLLLPEELPNIPSLFSGTVKLSKNSPHKKDPYNSIIQLEESPFSEVTNWMFKKTYQVDAISNVLGRVDRSFMIMQLPPLNPLQEQAPVEDTEFYEQQKSSLFNLLEDFERSSEDIKQYLTDKGWTFLKEKPISYSCDCSRERMLKGVKSLLNMYSKEELFEGKGHVETKCDYCKTYYLIKEDEV